MSRNEFITKLAFELFVKGGSCREDSVPLVARAIALANYLEVNKSAAWQNFPADERRGATKESE